MNLTHLNKEIQREQTCIEYLGKKINKHRGERNYEMSVARMIDMERSIRTKHQLGERKRLFEVSMSLAKAGILSEVVKRVH